MKSLRIPALLVFTVLCAPAARPVAAVVSWGALNIASTWYELRGVTRWLLTEGDHVDALGVPILIEFPDKSRAWIQNGGKVVVGAGLLRVQKGSVCWSPGNGNTRIELADGKPALPPGAEGDWSIVVDQETQVQPSANTCRARLPATRPMPNVF